jgi:hypothetical protein
MKSTEVLGYCRMSLRDRELCAFIFNILVAPANAIQYVCEFMKQST